MTPLDSCPILGIPLAVTDYAGAVAQVKNWAASADEPYLLGAANTHMVALGRHDAAFRQTLGEFDLLLPDGMPLVWAMNRKIPTPLRDRVYGPTFMLRCLEATQGETWSHLLIGGSEELLVALQHKLMEKLPGLRIAGVYPPPFGEWTAEENARIVEKIRVSGAQFIWIGLGCPKQENWLARHKALLPAGVYCAVGAAFAFHAGHVRQAPPLVQRAGLEWLFRLAAEPRRLWRRYVVFNTLFLFYLTYDSMRKN